MQRIFIFTLYSAWLKTCLYNVSINWFVMYKNCMPCELSFIVASIIMLWRTINITAFQNDECYSPKFEGKGCTAWNILPKILQTHSYLLTASLSRCLTVSLLQFLSFKFEFFMLLAEKLGFTFTLGITTYWILITWCLWLTLTSGKIIMLCLNN